MAFFSKVRTGIAVTLAGAALLSAATDAAAEVHYDIPAGYDVTGVSSWQWRFPGGTSTNGTCRDGQFAQARALIGWQSSRQFVAGLAGGKTVTNLAYSDILNLHLGGTIEVDGTRLGLQDGTGWRINFTGQYAAGISPADMVPGEFYRITCSDIVALPPVPSPSPTETPAPVPAPAPEPAPAPTTPDPAPAPVVPGGSSSGGGTAIYDTGRKGKYIIGSRLVYRASYFINGKAEASRAVRYTRNGILRKGADREQTRDSRWFVVKQTFVDGELHSERIIWTTGRFSARKNSVRLTRDYVMNKSVTESYLKKGGNPFGPKGTWAMRAL